MSDDFISLVCPTCGGKLSLSPNTTSFTCRSCGNDHVLRQVSGNFLVEAFAKCPQCHQNDKVEKVSAIVASQTHQLDGTTVSTNSYQDKDGKWHTSTHNVPFSGFQTSGLAQRLSPPTKPVRKSSSWVSLAIIGYIALAGCCICSSTGFLPIIPMGLALPVLPFTYISRGISNNDNEALVLGVVGLVVEIVIVLVAVMGLILFIKIGVPKIKKYSSRKKEEKRQKELEVQAALKKWEHAMQKWSKLYYCFRDDSVFIPGDNKSVDLSHMQEFIFK